MKIAITTSSFARYSDEPLKLLEQAGVEYVMNDKGRALTEEEAIQVLEGCHGVAAGTEPLTKKVMDALPDLKVISRCGTGMDNVDRAYAAEKGIEVRNTPDGPTLAVAELTLGLILTLLRQVPHQDRELRSGVWKKRMGNLLHGKNVGIVRRRHPRIRGRQDQSLRTGGGAARRGSPRPSRPLPYPARRGEPPRKIRMALPRGVPPGNHARGNGGLLRPVRFLRAGQRPERAPRARRHGCP